MERDEGNHHSQDGQGTVKGDLDIAKTDAGLFGKLADKSFSRKHDHIGNYLKADAKCHDNASDDQINKGRTPWTAEAGRDKAHCRINAEAELALETKKERRIFDTLTIDDCIPGSRNGDYEGELVVIRADILQRDKQTADYQLCRATGGFGCKASAGGRAVFCQTVFDNREMRYDRTDVLGVIKPERIPDWAKERIATRE